MDIEQPKDELTGDALALDGRLNATKAERKKRQDATRKLAEIEKKLAECEQKLAEALLELDDRDDLLDKIAALSSRPV